MTRREHGHPLRSASAGALAQPTRIGAVVALLIVAGAVTWDLLDDSFWARHTMITSLVASLLVIVVSLAVVNELVERRARQRWAVLAQYVLFDLVHIARAAWMGLLGIAGFSTRDQDAREAHAAGAKLITDGATLAGAINELLADPPRREVLQHAIASISRDADEVLGRWAGVMLSASAYTEVIDRHVELYSRIAWLDNLLARDAPADDDPRQRLLRRSSPTAQLQSDVDDKELCDMLVSVVQLAERLDHATNELAMQIVPMEWWRERVRAVGT